MSGKRRPGYQQHDAADGPHAVLVHGCYHTNNYGDLLLLQLLARRLSETYGASTICPTLPVGERDRLSVRPGHGLRSFLRPRAAIMGGGGYLNDRDGDPRQTRDLLRYSIPCLWWRATGVPDVVVGVGAGPWLSGAGAARVRAVCAGARAIAVRDEESKAVLTAVGVPSAKLEVTADLVVAMSKQDLPDAAHHQAASLLGAGRLGVRRFGIHLDSLVNQGPGLERILSVISSELPADGSIEAVWLVDRNGSEALRSRVQTFAVESFPTLRVLSLLPFLTIAALIGSLDAIITSKLHVGVTAWALGVPPCGYSTHPKTKRFYRQTGRAAFQADVWDAPPDVIRTWIRAFVAGDPAFMNVSTNSETVRRLARRNYEIVEEQLGGLLGPARPPAA